MSRYSFGKTVDSGFEQTIERVTQALAKEGFGVLSDIDVAATLKKKLGLDAEPQIGALLPCNVVVRRQGGKTLVEMMDPLAVMQLVEKPEVAKIANEVRGRLDRVLAAL